MRPFRPGGFDELDGISAETIADWTHVHITTARRYKRGEEPPFATMQLIRLRAEGDLGVIDPQWSGWNLRKGILYSPNDMDFTPADVISGRFWRIAAKTYEAEQRLPQQADWVSGRWEAGSESNESQVA